MNRHASIKSSPSACGLLSQVSRPLVEANDMMETVICGI